MILLFVIFASIAAAQDLSQQGARAMRQGRFADAERIYRQMLEGSPRDPRLRLNLGLALHSAGRYKEAIPEFELFLKANPQPGPAHLLAGVARLKVDRPCEAIPVLEKARQWQAGAQVLVELGDANSGCKRYLNAARAYQQAARLTPGDDRMTRAAARAFWQAREYKDARPLFAAIESHYSSEADLLYEYGDTLARLDGPDAGLPYLEKAVKTAPSLVPARGALGRVLLELNRAAESIPHLEAAAPADPTLLLPLSHAYKAMGRARDAARVEAEYRKTLAAQN
jgi:tetratricopeptide (TPR) repeat protein